MFIWSTTDTISSAHLCIYVPWMIGEMNWRRFADIVHSWLVFYSQHLTVWNTYKTIIRVPETECMHPWIGPRGRNSLSLIYPVTDYSPVPEEKKIIIAWCWKTELKPCFPHPSQQKTTLALLNLPPPPPPLPLSCSFFLSLPPHLLFHPLLSLSLSGLYQSPLFLEG